MAVGPKHEKFQKQGELELAVSRRPSGPTETPSSDMLSTDARADAGSEAGPISEHLCMDDTLMSQTFGGILRRRA